MIQRFFSFEKWFSSPEPKAQESLTFQEPYKISMNSLGEGILDSFKWRKKVNSRLVLLTFRKSSKPFSTYSFKLGIP